MRRMWPVTLVTMTILGLACAPEPATAPSTTLSAGGPATTSSATSAPVQTRGPVDAAGVDLDAIAAIGHTFVAAHTTLDETAAGELLHAEARIASKGQWPRTTDEYLALFGWYRALLWFYEPLSCSAAELVAQVRVDCEVVYNSVLTAAVGAEDIPSTWEFFIEDGLIVEFTEILGPEATATFEPWFGWLIANHSQDWPTMMRLDDAGDITGGPHTTPESLHLFEIHSREYFTDVTGDEPPELAVDG